MTVRLLSNVIAVAVAVLLATASSCKTFDLPAETCNPSTLFTRPEPSKGDCGRCLEDECCDAVGVCERTGGCVKIVSDTQKCVIQQNADGLSLEKGCAEGSKLTAVTQDGNLENPAADGAYRCMRSNCGAQCGLPVCQVDKAALLIRNAKCDGCFAGKCCEPLNGCYDNRACKLMLECITSTCGNELGKALDEPVGDAGAHPGTANEIAALCGEPPVLPPGMPECVRTCLCRYHTNDQALPPSDLALLPVNLAQAVYVCGKTARCGHDCAADADDAGHD
jgi:hypothetical protein